MWQSEQSERLSLHRRQRVTWFPSSPLLQPHCVYNHTLANYSNSKFQGKYLNKGRKSCWIHATIASSSLSRAMMGRSDHFTYPVADLVHQNELIFIQVHFIHLSGVKCYIFKSQIPWKRPNTQFWSYSELGNHYNAARDNSWGIYCKWLLSLRVFHSFVTWQMQWINC